MGFSGDWSSSGAGGLSHVDLDGYFLMLNTTNGPLTGSVVISPSGTPAQSPLTIRTNNTIGGVNDRYVTVGPTGSEILGVYTASSTGGGRAQISTSPLTISGSSTNASLAGAVNLTYNSTSPVRIQPQISYDGYGYMDNFAGLVRYKTSSQAFTTNTTLADDNTLTFTTLDANSRYIVEGMVFVTQTSGTGGAKIDLAGTVGVVSMLADVVLIDITTNTVSKGFRLSSLGSGGNGAGLAASDTAQFTIKGSIETSTAGTLKIQEAQSSSNGTTTFSSGSWLRVQKV